MLFHMTVNRIYYMEIRNLSVNSNFWIVKVIAVFVLILGGTVAEIMVLG